MDEFEAAWVQGDQEAARGVLQSLQAALQAVTRERDEQNIALRDMRIELDAMTADRDQLATVLATLRDDYRLLIDENGDNVTLLNELYSERDKLSDRFCERDEECNTLKAQVSHLYAAIRELIEAVRA